MDTVIEDKEIYELSEKGLSNRKIAKYFKEKGIEVTAQTIKKNLQEYMKERGQIEPKITGRPKLDEYNEEIYALREQGLTYQAIVEHFAEKGISISVPTIRTRCKEIYAEKGREEPKRSELSEEVIEEIYELREKRLSYEAIVDVLTKRGISICAQTIGKRCKEIYAKKRKEEPKAIILLEEYNEEIYELREQRLSYESIADVLTKRGISISASTIGKRCKEIYAKKGKEEPKRSELSGEVSIEEIYELREQRLSYESIADVLTKRGISISAPTIGKRCKEIYAKKGKEEPKAVILLEEYNEEIYALREKKYSYNIIAEYLNEKGIGISVSTINKRCKEIYAKKGKEEPRARLNKYNEEIYAKKGKEEPRARLNKYNEEIYALREKKYSYNIIAEYLNEKGIGISVSTINKRCKEIYAKKGKKEPRARLNKYNEEIYALREKKYSYNIIAEYLNEKGISIDVSTIRKRCKEIYAERGREEPKRSELSEEVIEEIYELREQRLSYESIADVLTKRGISISAPTIGKRCKEIYAEKGEEEPKFKGGRRTKEMDKISNKQLVQAILKLVETRKATVEQIKTIAEYYQVDLEKVFEDAEEER